MVERKDPPKRDYRERVRDFKEFVLPLSEAELSSQAGRCLDCGVAFCQSGFGCPVQNLIPDWNELAAKGRWKDALLSLHRTNNFPEFTGKLCPAPCESACVVGISDHPVGIRTIESSIVERGFQEGWIRPEPAERSTGKRIAIIGSGPAGLASAQELARLGHEVIVYEKSAESGGLLRNGIPDFKMEKWVLDRRLDQLKAEGVQFKTGVHVGESIRFEEILDQHDAVCLAIGAERPRDLKIPGRELRGIHFAMDFLTQQNRRISGEFEFLPEMNAARKKVVIIGGGDTGSDCLGTVLRQGGAEVTQFEILEMPGLERASGTPWPHWPLKLRSSHAHEEGGGRQWSVLTQSFIGADGVLTGLEIVDIAWKNGHFEKVAESQRVLEADMVLLALGFEGPTPAKWLDDHVRRDARGNIQIDSRWRTSHPKIFCAGDARRGASLVVWAIADGRKMAASVHSSL